MTRVPSIFKDPALQQQFEEDGFVKIDLLTEAEVRLLRELFHSHYPVAPAGFHSSSNRNDYEAKKKISDDLVQIIAPALEKVFTNYACFGSTFLTKEGGSKGELYMHQDWTIVDETKHLSLNVWSPLQDTNEENGTIEVVPGSHKWHDVLRAPSLPFYYSDYQQEMKKKLLLIPTKATEAVVLNHAVIHYSKPNKSSEIRLAVTTGLKTKDAPMLFYYWDKDKPNEIEQFNMEEDFLLRFEDFHSSIFKRPTIGTSAGTQPFTNKKPGQEEAERLFGNKPGQAAVETAMLPASTPAKKGFIQKLFSWSR